MGWKVPFTFEQGRDTLSNFGGLGIVGQILAGLPFGKRLQASQVEGVEQPDISHQDVATAMMGLIAMKMPTYEDIESVRDDEMFAMALGLEAVPSAPTLRQRIDAAAASEATSGWADAFNESSDHLLKQYAQMTPIVIGNHEYIPFDMDVSPMDNSKTKKEGVSRTYKGCDGFAPNMVYLGQEGYGLAVEFREGKQHCQNGTPALLDACLTRARQIVGPDPRIVVRLDFGNDASANLDICKEHRQVASMIKRNLRRESVVGWLALAKKEGTAYPLREGKIAYRGETTRIPKKGHDPERVVYEVIERTILANGQRLCVPEIEVATYWCNVEATPEEVLPTYPEHGTMEQFHSEYKTDLELERLPSGKFATNNLIMQMALLVFNVLRVMGQATLNDPTVPLRTPQHRRRLATVTKHLVQCAVKLVRHGRTLAWRYSLNNPWGPAIARLYDLFASP